MDILNDEKFDNILLDIIQRVNNLPNFLDILFGFLRRRTDLYYALNSNQQNMGFPPGKAENLILSAFRKHKEIFELSQMKKSNESEVNFKKKKLSSQKVEKKEVVNEEEFSNHFSRLVYVADAESYNGAVRDDYSWSQTIGELDIRVKIPENVNNSKEISVIIDKKHICVSCHNKDESHFTKIIDKDLCWDVKKNEAFWSFDRQKNNVMITVEKVQERWWDALLVGEELINTRTIDCSRPITDLDDEAQAKIQKLMYDNQQKQMGLPTSDQQKINEALLKAWNVDGSPFKGTKFDPSKFDVIGNNEGNLF